jgi:hypothetical protein
LSPASRTKDTLYRWEQCWEAVASKTSNRLPRPAVRAHARAIGEFAAAHRYRKTPFRSREAISKIDHSIGYIGNMLAIPQPIGI